MKCNFYSGTRSSVKHCIIMYGLREQQSCSNLTFINKGNPTTSQNIIISLTHLTKDVSYNNYCYSLIASNGKNAVRITGSFMQGMKQFIATAIIIFRIQPLIVYITSF